MRRLLVCTGLLAALPLLWPSEVTAQKKKGAPKVEETTEADYAQLRKLKEISGTLLELDPEGKKLTLRVEYNTYEPKQLKGKDNQQVARLTLQVQQQAVKVQGLQLQFQNAKTVRQQQQITRQLQTAANRLQQLQVQLAQLQTRLGQLKTVGHVKDCEFDVSPEVKVARAKPPMEYDDKGNVKEWTNEELKKMRDKELPGYTAKVEDLVLGQTVKLYLGKPKAAKKTSPGSKSEGDEGKKEGEAKKEGEPRKETEPKKLETQPKKLGEDGEKSAKEGDKGAKESDKKGEKKADEPPPPPYVRAILVVADPDPDAQLKTRPKKRKKDDE